MSRLRNRITTVVCIDEERSVASQDSTLPAGVENQSPLLGFDLDDLADHCGSRLRASSGRATEPQVTWLQAREAASRSSRSPVEFGPIRAAFGARRRFPAPTETRLTGRPGPPVQGCAGQCRCHQADHLARDVEHRAARVARIELTIDLNPQQIRLDPCGVTISG